MDSLAPTPSNDGRRVFFLGAVARGELVRYDPKSNQLTPYLSGLSAEGVSFSRDGQWVAYNAFPEGTLWRSKTDGSERLQLTFRQALGDLHRPGRGGNSGAGRLIRLRRAGPHLVCRRQFLGLRKER